MKILCDTSVLVAAVVKPHPNHEKAFRWLKKAKNNEIELIVAAHSLAELYHVLTRYPIKPRFSPGTVKRIIQQTIANTATIAALTSSEYLTAIERTADLNLSGGIVFDAILCEVALKMKVEKLLTFNIKDFKRLLPSNTSILAVP